MIVQCCDCKKVIREKPGPDLISHTWCDKCVIKVKKQLWDMIHAVGTKKHYHPWATDDGQYFVYESEPYRGGAIWTKKLVCESVTQAEDICKELNQI